jgi:hypothetical protein
VIEIYAKNNGVYLVDMLKKCLMYKNTQNGTLKNSSKGVYFKRQVAGRRLVVLERC